jgi:hypothetical protein
MNLSANIKYIHVLGNYYGDFTSLHTGLLYLIIEYMPRRYYGGGQWSTGCDNSDYDCELDNLPNTLIVLQVIDYNLIKKINHFPESLINLTLSDYSHDIDNLPVGIRYFISEGYFKTISNIPPNLVYFSSLTERSFHITEPFPEGLKHFGFYGAIGLEDISNLPDSVITLIIDEIDEINNNLSNINKYPKSLKSLICGDLACINFGTIPEGVEYLHINKNYLELIIPELLPKSLKYFKIEAKFFEKSDFENQSEDELENKLEDELEDDTENTNEGPRKKSRVETKIDILFEYLITNGITISYYNYLDTIQSKYVLDMY